jgi:hypothetical protein
MAVVAVENPFLGEAGLIREQQHCGKVRLLSTLVQKAQQIGHDEGNHWGPSRACTFFQWNGGGSCLRTTFHTRQ